MNFGVGLAGREHFRQLYAEKIRPFLESPVASHADLATPERAARTFQMLRRLIPPPLHDSLAQLESICEEHRQLSRQVKLTRWLHGWLLIHVPLSVMLLMLATAHAWMALRY